MSIINEALKKAEREKTSVFSEPVQSVIRKNMELEFQKKHARFNWGPIFVVLVLLLITGPIVAPIFSSPFKQGEVNKQLLQNVEAHSESDANATRVSSATSQAASSSNAQFAVEESPIFNAPPAALISRIPLMRLSGIVYSPKDSYCIINDKITSVGDSIQGATLESISADLVVLNYQGEKIALKVEG